MQQQIRAARLLERRAEGVHELVGQLADEADRVGQQVGPAAETPRARGRIERVKETVAHPATVGARERVQQRRLAGVGVAGEGDRRQCGALALGAHRRARAAHVLAGGGAAPRCGRGRDGGRSRSGSRRVRVCRSRRRGARGGSTGRACARGCTRAAPARPGACPRRWPACAAKMSRITVVRSTTGSPSSASRLRSWRGRELVVAGDHVRVALLRHALGLGDLAGPEVRVGVGLLAVLHQLADHGHPRGAQQLPELAHDVRRRRAARRCRARWLARARAAAGAGLLLGLGGAVAASVVATIHSPCILESARAGPNTGGHAKHRRPRSTGGQAKHRRPGSAGSPQPLHRLRDRSSGVVRRSETSPRRWGRRRCRARSPRRRARARARSRRPSSRSPRGRAPTRRSCPSAGSTCTPILRERVADEVAATPVQLVHRGHLGVGVRRERRDPRELHRLEQARVDVRLQAPVVLDRLARFRPPPRTASRSCCSPWRARTPRCRPPSRRGSRGTRAGGGRRRSISE